MGRCDARITAAANRFDRAGPHHPRRPGRRDARREAARQGPPSHFLAEKCPADERSRFLPLKASPLESPRSEGAHRGRYAHPHEVGQGGTRTTGPSRRCGPHSGVGGGVKVQDNNGEIVWQGLDHGVGMFNLGITYGHIYHVWVCRWQDDDSCFAVVITTVRKEFSLPTLVNPQVPNADAPVR